MHLTASPSPPPGLGPPPISSFSPLHFLALARLFSQSHLKLLLPLFPTAMKSKAGFRCAVRLCIAACRALLFCRLGSWDSARANSSRGCLQRLRLPTSLRGSTGRERRRAVLLSPVLHAQRRHAKPRPVSSTASCSCQHPGSKTRRRQVTYMCDGSSVGDGRLRRGSGCGRSLGDAPS